MAHIEGGFVGRSHPRTEDRVLVTGAGQFVDNLTFRGALHMVVVRSPLAHARIGGVDLSRALAVPGVVTALSGADLAAELAGPLPMIWPVPGCSAPDHWPLAIDEAKYMGDGLAVVVGESRAAAEDGAEAVEVDYEPLPVQIDLEGALDPGAPLVHVALGTNLCYELGFEAGRDVDAIFREAEVVVDRTFRQQRLIASPMEPRVLVAQPGAGSGEFVLWTSTQIPHIVKRTIGACVGLAEHRIRVVAPAVGGGFGAKLNVYAEEAIALALARRLGRAIRWVEERSEHAQATTHGRGQLQRVELAADADGTLRAVRVFVIASMGGYLQLETPGIPIIGRFLFSGAYRADGYGYRCSSVFTNQTPTGAYRGAGRPEAIYAIERAMDVLAGETGLDPADIRRRNFLPAGEFVPNPAGIPYDSVDYGKALDRALDLAGYADLRAEQKSRRAAGDPRRLGIGLAFYVDASGIGPSAVLAKTNYSSGGWEAGEVRIQAGGAVEVLTGSTAQGQGHDTVWAQVIADVLGVDTGDVKVHHGDTAVVSMGIGTFGSRSLIVGATAAYLAAQKVLAKARRIAAHMLEAAEEDVSFSGGRFSVAGAPERAVTIQGVAQAAFLAHDLPAGEEPGLHERVVLDPSDWTYPFGAHVVALEVDTETGAVEILDYVAVDDCGNVVNPMIVDGQVHGGVAQGIGQAIYEEAVYDEGGQLETTSFMNYLVPTSMEIPPIRTDRTVTVTSLNPLGAKGVGEAGTIAAPPAVMNAIHDAIGDLIGGAELQMPATPERIWRAIHGEERT